MLLFWLSAQNKEREAVGLAAKAMGCLFGCFGIKESRSVPAPPQEVAVSRSKNALSSLFVSDDETLLKGEEGQNPVLRQHDIKELNSEVKFIKTTEVQKDLGKENDVTSYNGEENSSKFTSWFSNASIDKLKQEKESFGSPVAVKIHDDCVTGSGSPSSCMTDGQNTGRVSSTSYQRSVHNAVASSDMQGSETRSGTSSISPLPFPKFPTKSAHFTFESNRSSFSSEGSSYECVSNCWKQSGFTGDKTVPQPCPYPTPLKLTDEMQTPGTEVPPYKDDACSQELPNNRSQRAYYVWNPVLNFSASDNKSSSNDFRESDEDTLIPTPMLGPPAPEDDRSLSSWFKLVSMNQGGLNKRFDSVSAEKVGAKTPGDRPIIGMVAAYWNKEEEPHIPPKWWDGNGIPNSTNKYKEDQKVSWHATPFEERLEKALSEETCVTRRKPVDSPPPVDFDETEESDTALSRLQSTSKP
ncbi:protein JASON-like isoform X1 [Andrographis paniculata]|uniref:protein JASON-like isoform X1 n=1 Tax=Andrographis paniculata TaxID=175694 RepID=UPI0021E84D02|nr:protein JASON-like isoform X1 [Andrographis paniculata]XP_051151818.1 protein JASON-like isoform X1 [Andrographis paniculata]